MKIFIATSDLIWCGIISFIWGMLFNAALIQVLQFQAGFLMTSWLVNMIVAHFTKPKKPEQL